MYMSKILAFIGPLIAMVGAALLAFDTFHASKGARRVKQYNGYMKSYYDIYNITVNSYPNPPYTADEIDAAKTEAARIRDESIAGLHKKMDEEELEFKSLVEALAGYGFILVALGSFMQAISVVIA